MVDMPGSFLLGLLELVIWVLIQPIMAVHTPVD
jgi:hypothetical protein